MTDAEEFIKMCNTPIKIKNPMDDSALIYVDNGVEIYRDIGWGYDKRRVWPDGKIKYLNRTI